MASTLKNKVFLFILIFIVATTITYINHFNNSFHFDDSHCIQNNVFIQSVKNIPKFFKDGTTFSSLPQNQSYRPIVSASLALDYKLGNGFNLLYFHLSTFIIFLLQGILMFFFIFKLLNKLNENKYNFFISATAVLWYSLHPANAETVNYIIARSEIQSTIGVILAFVLYQYSSICRKTFLYLLPVGIGALAKPPAIMFAPLFLFYLLLIEQELSIPDIFKRVSFKQVFKAIKTSIPAFIFCGLLYFFIEMKTPASWTPAGGSVFNYAISQPLVIAHYFHTFFLPLGLSADTDWRAIQSIWSAKFFIGIAFILILLAVAFVTSKKKEQRPISYGIIWFFVALLPTSSIIPLSEIMNDHRLFFPYVGLVISVCWAIAQLFMKLKERFAKAELAMILFVPVLLIVYGFGTYQRNKVWHSEESLWKDVTLKSPKNGRGLMNYGLVKMKEGNYAQADEYFNKATEYNPYYPTLYINLGISCNAQKKKIQAENYFKQAIKLGPNLDGPWYYYGHFLTNEFRLTEAIPNLAKAIGISPSNMSARNLLMDTYYELEEWNLLDAMAVSTLIVDANNQKAIAYKQACISKQGKLARAEEAIDKNPTPEQYLNLSLDYYKRGLYKKCIAACEKAIKLNPDYAEAYNNICSANNQLGNYSDAEKACEKAVKLKPDFQLAINNLKDLDIKKADVYKFEEIIKSKPSPENYINLSLKYFQHGSYEKCIEASQKAIELKPRYAQAYNNIGAAYNKLKKYNKAIEALNKALEIEPDYLLAKGNLAEAKDKLKK